MYTDKKEMFTPDPGLMWKLCSFSLTLAFQYLLIGASGMALQSSVNLQGSMFVAVVIAAGLFMLLQFSSTLLVELFIDHADTNSEIAIRIGKHFLQTMPYFMIILYLLDIFRALTQGMENSVYSMVSGIVES